MIATREPQTPSVSAEILLAALRVANIAHAVYEAEKLGGGYDPNWRDWYASHMADTLARAGYRLVETSDR